MRSPSSPRRPVTPRIILGLLLVAFAASPAGAQGIDEVKAHYTKYEHLIPMRDGKRLFTAVYVPKDASGSKPYPILLCRTPYSVRPYGVDQYKPDLGPSPLFGKAGYIVAYQDVRGRYMSEGEFVNMRPHRPRKADASEIDESTDTFDTIDWLTKHVEGNSGKVGMWGISYPGFYVAAGMIDAHPALKAASPQAPVTDWFTGDDFHHNGALFLPHFFNFIATFGRPRPAPTKESAPRFDHGTPDGYDFFRRLGPLSNADKTYFKGEVAFWNEVMEHPNYDEFWKSRNLRQHLGGIGPAVMTVGGWFDAENLFGALEVYRKVEAGSPRSTNILVMGPWFHGGWSRGDGSSLGHVAFNARTAEFYRENIEFPFFEKELKGKAPAQGDLPEAFVFETGKNQWRKLPAWPPAEAKPRAFYLLADGGLSSEAPSESTSEGARDEFVSDPAKPVPFIEEIAEGMTREYMVDDQRFAGRRTDVLVYKTPPLTEDLSIAGPIKVDLRVSTSGTDSDWIVKVIDVYPDDYPTPEPNPTGVKMGGFQQLLRGDVMRGRFRDGLEAPKPFKPDEPTAVSLTLNDVFHTFRPGHRLMIQVQSTWFPLVDLNPQTFVDIYKAKPSDFRKATQRVYRSRDLPSKVTFGVMGGEK